MIGKCKWFDPKRGFGFVTDKEGTDWFVHFRSIIPVVEGAKRNLKEGQEVEFEIGQSVKGRNEALNVKAV
jgi:CspA family cold shock protein